MMPNQYSDRWFDLFAHTIDASQTRREVEFLSRQLPLGQYPRVLDICCGTGRHAALLLDLGYEITAIDIKTAALARARQLLRDPARVIELDMRELDRLNGDFDAALLLWQSFGDFDADTNAGLLRKISDRLVRGGRFMLDIYHREFFESHQGTRTHQRVDRTIIETKRMRGNRLTVELDYGDGRADQFEWQLYSPTEIIALARTVELMSMLVCAEFDETIAASADRPRVQFVFQKQ